MSDPNSTSPDILSDGPVKYILRPDSFPGLNEVVQVLGPGLWGNRPFLFFIGWAEEGAKWDKCPTSPWY
jgi:hypothetical protein